MPSFSSTHTYPSLQDGKFLDWSDSDFILKEVDKILTLPWWTGTEIVYFSSTLFSSKLLQSGLWKKKKTKQNEKAIFIEEVHFDY